MVNNGWTIIWQTQQSDWICWQCLAALVVTALVVSEFIRKTQYSCLSASMSFDTELWRKKPKKKDLPKGVTITVHYSGVLYLKNGHP